MPSRRSTESSARTTRSFFSCSAAGVRSGGYASARPGCEQLVDPLGRGQAAQLVLAEVARLDAPVQLLERRLREEHLPPCPASQSRAARCTSIP